MVVWQVLATSRDDSCSIWIIHIRIKREVTVSFSPIWMSESQRKMNIYNVYKLGENKLPAVVTWLPRDTTPTPTKRNI